MLCDFGNLEREIERLEEEVTKDDLANGDDDEAVADSVAMGISVEALTDESRRKHRVKKDVSGVRVIKVDIRSVAAGKLLEGDIIEEVAFEPVADPKAFEEAIMGAKETNSPIMILVNRGGNYLFYSLDFNS